jgi:hypothetical protein
MIEKETIKPMKFSEQTIDLTTVPIPGPNGFTSYQSKKEVSLTESMALLQKAIDRRDQAQRSIDAIEEAIQRQIKIS